MADRPHDNGILVLGLGRFGGAIAETLVKLGHEVLAVDIDHKIVQSYAGRLTHVVEADTTDEEALRQLGARRADLNPRSSGNSSVRSLAPLARGRAIHLRECWFPLPTTTRTLRAPTASNTIA